ncbi:hypothetical protein LIER_06788 [Lithospermum erythrorhizon]|uniref:Uncharacterized protein n=1 Tax=Lithospermum erythrorhizon TaxID=34254 RepID=A0AAV3PA52_LITER
MDEEVQDLPSSSIPPPSATETAVEDQSAAPPPPSSTGGDKDTSAPPPTQRLFDPTRMIGIIRRKALIKDLAAVYHAECLSYCQQLLEFQKQTEEPFADLKHQEDARKAPMRPPKRSKKVR